MTNTTYSTFGHAAASSFQLGNKHLDNGTAALIAALHQAFHQDNQFNFLSDAFEDADKAQRTEEKNLIYCYVLGIKEATVSAKDNKKIIYNFVGNWNGEAIRRIDQQYNAIRSTVQGLCREGQPQDVSFNGTSTLSIRAGVLFSADELNEMDLEADKFLDYGSPKMAHSMASLYRVWNKKYKPEVKNGADKTKKQDALATMMKQSIASTSEVFAGVLASLPNDKAPSTEIAESLVVIYDTIEAMMLDHSETFDKARKQMESDDDSAPIAIAS